MPILLVGLMVLFYSFQSLFTRFYSVRYAGPDQSQSTAVFSICYGVFIAIASLAVNGFRFAPSWQTWLLGLVNGSILVLYNTSIIEAGNRGSYSFLMISGMFGGILVPMAIGLLFLQEHLNPQQTVAVILMLVSLVVMNLKGISFKDNSKTYYIWCILLFLANGLYGALMNLQAIAMNGAERTEMLTVLFSVSALSAAVASFAQGKGKQLVQGFKMGTKAALSLLVCCISATAAANLLLYILSQMESSILYTINNGGVLVLSILYSLVLFKERPNKGQIIGMIMAVTGIMLIELAA